MHYFLTSYFLSCNDFLMFSVLVCCKYIFFFLAAGLSIPSLHFASLCVYIFLTWSFLLDYFSPSLPLQAAVAATANTSTVTTTAGALGAPGGLLQRAPGSQSPGPAYNIPSVNEGTDWTDGYRLGTVSQSYSFSQLLSFVFGDLLLPRSSFLHPFLLSFPFVFLIFRSAFLFLFFSQFFTSPLFTPSVIHLHPFFLLLFFSPCLVTSLHQSCFFLQPMFQSPVSRSSSLQCPFPCFGLQRCLFICLSIVVEFSPLSIQSVEEIDSFGSPDVNAAKHLAQEMVKCLSDLVMGN